MKGAKFLLGITLSLGTLGAAVGGAVFANNTNKSAEPAEAAASASSMFFVDISSFTDWIDNNANGYICVYFYNSGSDNAWSNATRTAYSGRVYNVTVPGSGTKTWSYAIAVRINGSNPSWNVAWNQTGDLTLGSNNGIKITDWNAGELTTFYGFEGGKEVFVNYNDTDWWNEGSDQYMYFFDAADGSAAVWQRMYTVHNAKKTDSDDCDNILECIVPSGKTYFQCIAVRIKTGLTPSWDNKEQQSDDYKAFSGTSVSNNALCVRDGGWGKNATIGNAYSVGDEQRAKWYGYYFIAQTDATCSTKTAPSAATWTALETEYGHMNTTAKNTVKNAHASESGESYQEAMARYDQIVTLRGKSNFMSRTIGTSNNVIGRIITEDNTGMIIAVIFSTIVILGIGGYFYFRKRKVTE